MSSPHIISLSNGTVQGEPVDPIASIIPDKTTPRSSKVSPSHKLALTGSQCVVCGDTSPNDGGFRRHYGVICCEACKCFFRRTVQMGRDYKCRFGERCTVGRTAVNLKQICQACRFTRCLKTGMKIESVKKFPRKPRDESNSKKPRKSSRASKDKQTSVITKPVNDSEIFKTVSSPLSGNSGSDIEEFSHLKFNVTSPELMMLENTNVQLFNYESLENLSKASSGSPAAPNPTNGSSEDVSRSNVPLSNPTTTTQSNEAPQLTEQSGNFFFPSNMNTNNWAKKPLEHLSVPNSPYLPPASPSKRPRIESVGSELMSYSSPGSYYHGASHSAPQTPLNRSQPSSRVNSPDPGMSSVYNSVNNTPYATPSQTPAHSPLPSPQFTHPPYMPSQNFPPDFTSHIHMPSTTMPQLNTQQFTASQPGVNQLPLPGFSSPNNILALQQPAGNAIIAPMPFPLFPVVQFSPFSASSLTIGDPHQMGAQQGGSDSKTVLKGLSGKSPFRIVPIPSINKTQPPEEPECAEVSQINRDVDIGCDGMISASQSARSSPVQAKKTRGSLPEANVEEVLESLRIRIRSMFKWAKSEVAGFDDLSPLDQKALLRKTVAELVMLGFARGSIAYKNMLLLGSTGAVLHPCNPNPGIASVASVTLEKLVVPLKVLNISDKELRLLREIVLFNPEANGLRNREIVRQYRKRKHIELMEYTEKHSEDPGRFGELMCLLTPLFEVGLEVTEQLRLEQFVHEGEARIDALLLMSMISGAEEMPTESTVDQ